MSRSLALVLAASLGPVLIASLSKRSSAQPAVVAPMPSSSVKVNEDPAPPIPVPKRSLSSWPALWKEIPKSAPDQRIALAEIERAEAATRIAWGNVLPTLTGNVTLSYSPSSGSGSRTVGGGSSLSAQLTATATLINIRAFHAIGTAHVQEDIAHLSLIETRRRLALGLARGAASIAAARRLSEGNRTSLDLALQRLDLTKKRLAAGVGDMRDLVRAQQDVATARAVIAPADESLLQAEEGLAAILASPEPVGLSFDLDQLEKELQGFCGNATTDKERVDVQIAKKQILVAERNVDDITLKFLPTLTAQASAGTFGTTFEGPFTNGWQISATLSIPLFDGGVRYGEKRDRIALVEEAKARSVQTEVGVLVERAQARRAIDVAIAAQTAAKEARDLAAEADRLARLAYAGGVGTNFDLIDAGRTLRNAETQLILRDLDGARARLALPFIEGACAGTATEKS
jgi:outer membrane protein TolC